MVNVWNNDDNLLILSDDNSIDFLDEKSENNSDDFDFTLIEENPVETEVSSTKNDLNDLLSQTKENTLETKNELSDLLNESKEAPKKSPEIEQKPVNDIDFWSILNDSENKSPKEENILEEKSEEKNKPKKEENIDFWNIFENTDETPKKEETNLPKKEEKQEENIFSLDEKTEEKIEKNPLEDVQDISEILLNTVKQFEKREEIINSEIEEKEKHIKALKEELNIEEELVSDLKGEKEAIGKNKKSIEKMKNDYEQKSKPEIVEKPKTTRKTLK